jgi:hypothetical protein
MKKSIGKPCEGKLHARFDEGGADCFIIFVMNNSKAIRLYSTEASQYFNFENESFKNSGIYIDIDVSKQLAISHSEIKTLIKNSMSITWERIDQISKSVGL